MAIRKNEVEILTARLAAMPEAEQAAIKAEASAEFQKIDEAAREKARQEQRAARVAIVDAYKSAGLALATAMKSRPVWQLAPALAAFAAAKQKVSARGIDPKLLQHEMPGHLAAIDPEAFSTEVLVAYAAALVEAQA